MSILQFLKEELDSPKIMAGRTNVYFDEAKGGYEVYFKVGGVTYSFLAESEGTTYDDEFWKIQLRKKWAGNTEMIEDTKEVQDAFVEAMSDWVELRNPTSFYWISSEKYPAYNNIANQLFKKLKSKEYNFLDESSIELPKYDVVENKEEIKYKRFIFSKLEIQKEELEPEDWVEKKMDEFSETTGVYELPEEIKPNPDHTTPFAKNGKLDKGVDYKDKKLS